MPDENQNMIPDRWDRVFLKVGASVSALTAAILPVLKVANGSVPVWLLGAAAVVPALTLYFALAKVKS